MASSTAGAAANRLSFAKVAAMAPPQKVAKTANSLPKGPDAHLEPIAVPPTSNSVPLAEAAANVAGTELKSQPGIVTITNGLNELKVASGEPRQTLRNGQSTATLPIAMGPDESHSHLSNSSMKPTSFDAKSLSSDNTFALDEKESLRPDDSASVQATDEDESLFVPPVSCGPSTHLVADSNDSGPGKSPHDIVTPLGHVAGGLTITSMANPPRFGEIMPSIPPTVPLSSSTANILAAKHSGIEPTPVEMTSPIPPDEKLIEAMGTPKDRLLLLQLEEKFLVFLAQSKDASLDLPPQNSYERLLAHKLADYYSLSRCSSIDTGAIRLYKTGEVRPPVLLSELCRSDAGKDAASTGPVAVKIMRRTALGGNKFSNDGSIAASSSGPSKTTSEIGAENTSDEGIPSPLDAPPFKDRSQWTREEREAHYKAARERIFRDFQEVPSSENSTGDASADMSRSNSVNAKKRGYKQRTPRDDSFEARSSYIPGFPGMTYAPQNQANVAHATNTYPSAYGSRPTMPIATMAPGSSRGSSYGQYDPPPTTFQGANYPTAYPSQYESGNGWPNVQSPQPGGYYDFAPQPGSGYGPYGSTMPSSVQPYPQMVSPAFQPHPPQWSQGQCQTQFQPPYQAHPMMQPSMGPNGAPMAWPNYTQPAKTTSPDGGYPLGAMLYPQYQAAPLALHGQHPPPGSYNRPTFNPQIRSFVPSVSPVRYGASASPGRPLNPSFGGPGANNIQHIDKNESDGRGFSATLQRSQESLQKKWGTPAHLPKKPPPSQIPSTFEMENTPPLPSRQSFPPTCA